jgi:hypothetical protein
MDPRSPFTSGQDGAAHYPDPAAPSDRYPTQPLGGTPAWSAPPLGGPMPVIDYPPVMDYPPVWRGPPTLAPPPVLGMRLIVIWHGVIAGGFAALTLTMVALVLMMLVLGEGPLPPARDLVIFFVMIFVMIALPLAAFAGCIAVIRGLLRRRAWAAWISVAFHSLLIIILAPMALLLGLPMLVSAAGALLLIAPIVITYLMRPATRVLFR